MPITVVAPQPGDKFGQGFAISVSSDFTGPIQNPQWWIEFRDTDGTKLWSVWSFPFNASSLPNGSNYRASGNTVDAPPVWMNPGQNGKLRVELRGSAGAVETTDVTVELSMEATPVIISQQLGPIAAQSTSISQITQDVGAIREAVSLEWAPGIIGTISDLLFHPGPGFLVRELIGDFEGIQSFQRTAPGVGVNAFGLMWEVVSYGGGIGIDPTTPVFFETQLLLVEQRHTLADDQEYTSNVSEFHYSGGLYLFEPSFPTRINVTIAPSVTMRFWWLLVGLG
jgi:hypothetical protein